MWAAAHGALDWGEGSEMEGRRHTDAHCFPPARGAHSLLSSVRLGPGALRLSLLGQEVPEDQCRPRACSGGVPRLWSRDSPAWPGKGVPPEVKFGPLALVVLMNFLKPGARMALETQVPKDTAGTRSPTDSTA